MTAEVKISSASSADLDRSFAELQVLVVVLTRKVEFGEALTLAEALSVMQCIGITQGVLSERSSIMRKREASNG